MSVEGNDAASHNTYSNPLSTRYASAAMPFIFSDRKKFSTWRQLWVWLARAEMELSLPITPKQVAEMEKHVIDIDFAAAA